MEKDTRRRVADHFDLIVGTSTGGILALGLGLGFSANELRAFYIENGAKIFDSVGWWAWLVHGAGHLFGPKYSQQGLRTALTEKLGDRLLGHSKVRLVIPTFDALKGTACTFKTAHHERTIHEYTMPAIDVALATAAAPAYFEAAQIPSRPGCAYLDGGVWANSPVVVGIVEAISFLGRDVGDIDLLSMGTVEE